MSQNSKQIIEIDLKDIILYLIKKFCFVLMGGILLAVSFFSYKFISATNDSNVLDTSSRIGDETDYEYSQRISCINRAKDIIDSIDSLNNQIENQRKYVSDSLLMQIDSTNEAVTTAQFVISIDDSMKNGIDKALVSTYSRRLKSGDYLVAVADSLGTEQEYIKELISVDYDDSNSIAFYSEKSNGSVGVISITVIGPSFNFTETIIDCIIEELSYIHDEYNDSLVSHTITLTGKESFIMVDNETRDLQYSATNRFESVQKQITVYDDSLKDIASKLGLENKSSLYSYFSFNNIETTNTSPLGTSIKFSIIGFVFGAFIVVFFLVMKYLVGIKFSTQASFFGRFSNVYKIGVVKPQNKRSRFAAFIDRKTGDDYYLSVENSNRILSANIKNLTSGMEKVMFTGTAEISRIQELVNIVSPKSDVNASIFADPICLERINSYDGIILVEQRDYSDTRLISEEIKLISNANVKLIGAIII